LEELEGLKDLSNFSVIPLVIFIAQAIKNKLPDFKYGTDVLVLVLSISLCFGWEFYYMTPQDLFYWQSMSGLQAFKWFVYQSGVGIMTGFSASKIYDLGHGNKKRDQEVSTQLEIQMEEKVALQKEIIKLKNGNGEVDEQTTEDPVVSDKLRAILEG
jgi:hypothetical protein